MQQNKIFDPTAKVMAIDDSPINRMYIEKTFTPPNFVLLLAENAKKGIEKIKEFQPELILLDVMMPDVDGFTLCKQLKEDAETRNIPIIFITALDDIDSRIKAFEIGGADYVTKPFNHKEIQARVTTQIKLHREIEQRIKMTATLREQQKNETILRIAAGISHNFNNMLGVAQGNLSFLSNVLKDNDNEYISGALSDTEKSLRRLHELVQKFMLLIGKEPAKSTEKCNLYQIIESIIETIRNQKAGEIPVEKIKIVNLLDKETRIMCNYKDIFQSLFFLISEPLEMNAFRPEITIRQTSSENSKNIKIIIKIENIKLSGMPDIETIIFEPFGLPLANVGTGMGFAVAKELIERNNGDIVAKVLSDDNEIKNELDFVLTLKA